MSSIDHQAHWYFEESVPTLAPWRTPLTKALRWKFFLTGFVFPSICFLFVGFFGGAPTIGELWQSGEPSVYIQLLLSSPSFLFCIPILFYSMICMAAWCYSPKYSNNIIIRFGLYSGCVLASIFFLLLVWITAFISPIFALTLAVVLAVVIQIAKLLLPKFRKFTILHLLIATTFVAVSVALITNVDSIQRFVAGIIGSSFAFVIGGCVPLACLSFLRTSVAAYHINFGGPKSGKRWSAPLLLFTWLASFAATWKFAIESVIRQYENLPTQPPQGCFVSCAAAHGHSWLVGTKHSESIKATRQPINMQMRRLKLLEFALQTLAPAMHRNVRSIYNFIGPKIASVCRSNRWFADFAFIVLCPLEWLAIGLQHALNINERQLHSIYRNGPNQDD